MSKHERPAARLHGSMDAPVGCPDATREEIQTALAACCKVAGVIPGRAGEYDRQKDSYLVVGKSVNTGKAQDFAIEGVAVAALIYTLRDALRIAAQVGFDIRSLAV